MDPPRLSLAAVAILAMLACRAAPSTPATLRTSLVPALNSLPWDRNAPAGSALCPFLAPCDTLLLEPRVVRLPHPAPVFFVPDARPALLVLEGAPESALPGIDHFPYPVRYGGWTECLGHRHDSDWTAYRRVCVAVGVAGDSLVGDTLHLALLVLSPGEGLRWPRIQLLRSTQGWHATLVSMGGE